jgi:hypothetical protein
MTIYYSTSHIIDAILQQAASQYYILYALQQ